MLIVRPPATRKLSIFTRLMLGNLAVLLMATAVGAYTILQLGRMHALTGRIIQVHNVLIDLNKEMGAALLSQTRYEKKFLLVRDQALYDGYLAARTDFGQYLEQAQTRADSGEVRQALQRIRSLHRRHGELFLEEVRSLKRSGRPPLVRHDREKERLVQETLEELTRLRTLSQQSILQKANELEETGGRTRTVAMLITAIALLLGILLSVAITRSITLPLSRMKRKTEEIARGAFTADLRLTAPPEIESLAAALNVMCRKLEELERMKSDFYALMSHELRTPLTSIREGTNLFLEGLCGEVTHKQRELLVIIAEESSRLIDLVGSLLDLSKLESGVLAFHFGSVRLPPLIVQVLREMSPLAAAKGVTLDSEHDDLPALSLDPERILQVMRNLVGNALKFTPPGGTVRIVARSLPGEVCITVSDAGPGIATEEREIIFEKYRQALPSVAGGNTGTGLGLAIVRHIVQAHGGRVWVESEPGQGSTFIVALPA